jgi:hypothetical protein
MSRSIRFSQALANWLARSGHLGIARALSGAGTGRALSFSLHVADLSSGIAPPSRQSPHISMPAHGADARGSLPRTRRGRIGSAGSQAMIDAQHPDFDVPRARKFDRPASSGPPALPTIVACRWTAGTTGRFHTEDGRPKVGIFWKPFLIGSCCVRAAAVITIHPLSVPYHTSSRRPLSGCGWVIGLFAAGVGLATLSAPWGSPIVAGTLVWLGAGYNG